MSVVDLFIRDGWSVNQGVFLQAATEQARVWLASIKYGRRIGEALWLQSEEAAEAVLSLIPESFKTITM